jgi:protein-S-isoprenylcysteine O-methyltransferase Ste14
MKDAAFFLLVIAGAAWLGWILSTPVGEESMAQSWSLLVVAAGLLLAGMALAGRWAWKTIRKRLEGAGD